MLFMKAEKNGKALPYCPSVAQCASLAGDYPTLEQEQVRLLLWERIINLYNMRIIHFSDFHLCSGRKMERSLAILDRMLETLVHLNNESAIDLIVFSGDLVDKGGAGFEGKLPEAFAVFKTHVIDKIVQVLGIPYYHFLFVPGNHDTDREKTDSQKHKKLVKQLKEEWQVEDYMNKEDIENLISNCHDFISFQHDYYKQYRSDGVEIFSSLFETNIIIPLELGKVGVTLLNSSWMCYDDNDEKHIVMGKRQLSMSWPKLKECIVKIAVSHHHPSFLKSFETSELNSILHTRYDIFMCGHTHEHKTTYVLDADGSVLESVASGNLYNNLHQVNPDYSNGFSLLDFEEATGAVEETPYRQQKDESFNIVLDYGVNGDGTLYMDKPNKSLFEPLDSWLIDFSKKIDTAIIGEKVLEKKRNDLRNNDNRKILLTGLTGLGKTRLLYDAFNDGTQHPNAFYILINSNNVISLNKALDDQINRLQGQEGLIIIDNCSITKYHELEGRFPYNVRAIFVNNQYYNLSLREGTISVKIDPTELRPYVEELIDESLSAEDENRHVREEMKRIAYGFPFMAYKLISEYQSNHEVKITSAYDLVPQLLNYEEELYEKQKGAMMVLALFQPFPQIRTNRSAYEFILNNNILTQIEGGYWNRRTVINNVVNRFQPTLVEKTGGWINVRPFPLAVWLVGEWLKTLDEDCVSELLDNFEELKSKDLSAYNLLSECLSERIKYMNENEYAQDIIDSFTNGENAPFANEKVVCSDLGSRLFLSMSSVNPVAISNCLCKLLELKTTVWLYDNIKGNSRRNLIWALEKLCFVESTYSKSIILLAKLALAENETYGNNATGQFKQLFHICLAGTQANLLKRLETISELIKMGESYHSLVVMALDSAFMSSGFSRSGGAERMGTKELEEFMPLNREVWEYWEGCRDLVISLISKNPQLLDKMSDIVVTHSPHWIKDGFYDDLFYPMASSILSLKNNIWPELYESLTKFISRRFSKNLNDNVKLSLNALIESIRPVSFLSRLKDAQLAFYEAETRTADLMLSAIEKIYIPLAEEFINNKIYDIIDEIEMIVECQDYIGFSFSKSVVDLMNDDQLDCLYTNVLNVLLKHEDGFHSPFVIRLCWDSREREPFNSFLSCLLKNNYKLLFVKYASECDNAELIRLKEMTDMDKNGAFSFDFLSIYVTSVSEITTQMLEGMISFIRSRYPNNIASVISLVLRNRFRMQDEDPESLKSLIKDTLLCYPINDENPRLNFEYSRFVVDLLDRKDDPNFAVGMCRKLIEGLNQGYLHGNFEGIFSSLLLNYTDYIWEDFKQAFVSDDYLALWVQLRFEVGSGFGFGAGPLFQLGDERIKEMCKEYPQNAPVRIAELVPVYSTAINEADSFSPLFLWLLDEYGDNDHVLSGLHSNIHSYSWTGSTYSLFKQHKKCFEKLLKHSREKVRLWVERCIKEIDSELQRQRDEDDYMRLHYGHIQPGSND